MKQLFCLFIFQFLLISCGGQEGKSEPEYSQKIEYGFRGPLKTVKLYGVNVIDGTIPKDSLNYLVRVDYLFSKKGDLLTRNSLFKKEDLQVVTNITYSGSGKNIKYQKEMIEKGKNKEVENYSLNWLDAYRYKIVKENGQESDYTEIFLDKNYILVKAITKMDSTYLTENLETTFTNGRIEKVYSLSTMRYGPNDNTTSRIDATESYDQHGNPTKIYSYTDGKLTMVYFKLYEYYQ